MKKKLSKSETILTIAAILVILAVIHTTYLHHQYMIRLESLQDQLDFILCIIK